MNGCLYEVLMNLLLLIQSLYELKQKQAEFSTRSTYPDLPSFPPFPLFTLFHRRKLPSPMWGTRFELSSYFYSKIPSNSWNAPKRALKFEAPSWPRPMKSLIRFIITCFMTFKGGLIQICQNKPNFIRICFYCANLTI